MFMFFIIIVESRKYKHSSVKLDKTVEKFHTNETVFCFQRVPKEKKKHINLWKNCFRILF